MSTTSQPGSAQPEQRLAKGTLSTLDAIVISVSVLAPGMAMFLNVPGVAAIAGGSTPLAFLLGGIACLALAFVVIGFTRRMAAAGYAYTYASRSLGKSAGFMAGWLYAFGLICFVPMTMAGVAYLTVDLLKLDAGWWFPIFLVGMALLVVLSIIRIKVTTKFQLVVGVHHGGVDRGRRPGRDGQGRCARQLAPAVHVRAHQQGWLLRGVLRDHPRHHVVHRLRDRGRLR